MIIQLIVHLPVYRKVNAVDGYIEIWQYFLGVGREGDCNCQFNVIYHLVVSANLQRPADLRSSPGNCTPIRNPKPIKVRSCLESSRHKEHIVGNQAE